MNINLLSEEARKVLIAHLEVLIENQRLVDDIYITFSNRTGNITSINYTEREKPLVRENEGFVKSPIIELYTNLRLLQGIKLKSSLMRAYRLNAQMSTVELAKAINVSKSEVARWESTYEPKDLMFQKIMSVLNIKMDF